MLGRIALIAIWLGTVGAAASETPARGAASVSDLLKQCDGKRGWEAPAPPVHIYANVYQVGTCNIVALLITSNQGHVLIDASTDEAGPAIVANIQRLGFRLKDVKVLLNSHAHDDHAAGLPVVQKATGAALYASAASKPVMEGGQLLADDPQFGLEQPWPKATVSRVLRDGDVVRVGPIALTAHLTPGHTYGGTTWTWRSCEKDGKCADIVFADSVGAVTNETYRYGEHPKLVSALRASIEKIEDLKCDILLTGHPVSSKLYERLQGKAPLIEPAACRDYAKLGVENLEKRLAAEADEDKPKQGS